jgi:septal ring factor EnvC (AmiA/AmiB activator)
MLTAALWFLVGAAIAAFVLCVWAALTLAIAMARTARRARQIELPDIDLEKTRAAVLRIQSALEALPALLDRAKAAIERINAEVRAMTRALARAFARTRES